MTFPQKKFELLIYGNTKYLRELNKGLNPYYDEYGIYAVPLRPSDPRIFIPDDYIFVSRISSDNISLLRQIIRYIESRERNLFEQGYYPSYRLVELDHSGYKWLKGQLIPTQEDMQSNFGDGESVKKVYDFSWTKTEVPFMDGLELPILSMFFRHDFRSCNIHSRERFEKGYLIFYNGLAQLDYSTIHHNRLKAIGKIHKHGELFIIKREQQHKLSREKVNFEVINDNFDDSLSILISHEKENAAVDLLRIKSISDYIQFHSPILVMAAFNDTEPPFKVSGEPIEKHFHHLGEKVPSHPIEKPLVMHT